MPVSAATVTAVLCEAAFFGSFPLNPTRSAYARLNPPIPTPWTGWCNAILIPCVTSFARPLDALFRPEPDSRSSEWRMCGVPSATAAITAAATPSARAARQRQRNAATTAAPTISAAKLDCENEKSSPAQIARSRRRRRTRPRLRS